jgi:hypothetical protein
METIVKIIWDKPEEQNWLCADNINIALSEYCKNTKFEVIEVFAELETGECGHEVHSDFMLYDMEGCGTCMKCHAGNLASLLKSEKEKNKKLRNKIKLLK